MKYHNFSLFPTHSLHIGLFHNVNKIEDTLTKLMASTFQVALINPIVIIDEFQVLVAANKALASFSTSNNITKTPQSELVYNLSPSNNIAESLKIFGVYPSIQSVLVAILDCDENGVKAITSLINGEEVDLSHLHSSFNEALIRKHYHITPIEANPHDRASLLKSIVNAISTKGIL